MPEPTATNPQTGEKVVFRGGQWVPLTTAPAVATPPATPAFIPGQVSPIKQAQEQRAQQDQTIQLEQLGMSREDQEFQRQKFAIESARAERQERKDNAGTVDEKKIATLVTRLATGLSTIEDAERNDPNAERPGFVEGLRGDLMPGGVGGMITRAIAGPNRRMVHDAQRDMLDSLLTLGTGAAYNAEQLSAMTSGYFPQYNDTPEEAEGKRARLATLIEAAKVNAGPAWANVEPIINRYLGAADPATGEGQEAGAVVADRWPGVIGQDGKPLPPEGGYGKDPTTGEWGIYGRVTDDSPASPPSGGGGGLLGDLGAATQNAVAGAAQGVAGIYDLAMDASTGVQRGVNYVTGRGGEALLDAFGLPAAADWWRQGADANENALATTPSAAGAIEQISPTPEGMGAARFTAQLLGGLAVPMGPKAVPRPNALLAPPTNAARGAGEIREIIEEGARNNVRVMTSDVRPPTTFTGKVARATGERIPYAGTGGPRAAQQAERVQAVKDLAREVGADAGNELIDEVAQDFATTRGAKLTRLKSAKDGVIDGVQGTLGPVDVRRTLEAIDTQVRRLSGIDAEAYKPVIERLTQFGANIASGKTLRQVEGNRALLGEMFEDTTLAAIKGEGQKAVNAIYAPLRDDMGDFIAAKAGDAARSRWKGANDQLAQMAGDLGDNVFRSVLRSNESTPENVARLLFSKKPSEVRRLVSNLSDQGRRKAQAAIIHRAIEQAGGLDNVSPDVFANAIGKVGRAAGVVFAPDDLARVRGLERLLQATKQASVASAAPPTGVQNSQLLMAGGVGATGGTGAVVLGGIGGLARLYESATVRNLLLGLSKTPRGSKGERQILERIMKVAASQSQIRGVPANDVLAASPGRLAAQEQERN